MTVPAELTYLLDARWFGIGGAGRVTQNLVEGLRTLEPPGTWLVWGPPQLDGRLWSGARLIAQRHPPTAWLAQREWPAMRRRAPDVAFFVHQIRPMARVAPIEVTVVHDTIGLRYPTRGAPAVVFRAQLQRVAHLSEVIATVSRYSAGCIERDLGVASERICVLDQPVDHAAAARVRASRAHAPTSFDVLYVGRDAPHKNLDRAVRAFASTRLCERGGSLVLVGVSGRAAERLEAVAAASGSRVRLPGVVAQAELERLMSTCAVLLQPSIEEGFGLPAAEALAAGIPIAVSGGGALAEIVRGACPTFDPLDVKAMAAAIDRASDDPQGTDLTWPTPLDLARGCLDAITRAVQRHQLTVR